MYGWLVGMNEWFMDFFLVIKFRNRRFRIYIYIYITKIYSKKQRGRITIGKAGEIGNVYAH
jgi:hypothetical protein